jgi:transcription elongation GreA/GreB family factor
MQMFVLPQALQQETREMQTIVNRLNHDVVDLTQNADEHLARRLRDEMQRLNESWSHIISSTKVFSQNIQVSDETTASRCIVSAV